MKLTFNSIEEEFIYYAKRAIRAKDEGNEPLFLVCLARARELMGNLPSNDIEKVDDKENDFDDKPIPR